MRVLVVSQYFWPENFRINDLVSELTARGHSVTVLTGVPNYPEGRTFPGGWEGSGPVFPVRRRSSHLSPHVAPPSGQDAFGSQLSQLRLVGTGGRSWRLRGRRFDAIFVFQISPITAALPAVLQRRLKKAPLLLWVLDLWPETLAAGQRNKIAAGADLGGLSCGLYISALRPHIDPISGLWRQHRALCRRSRTHPLFPGLGLSPRFRTTSGILSQPQSWRPTGTHSTSCLPATSATRKTFPPSWMRPKIRASEMIFDGSCWRRPRRRVCQK